jgi:hypothetical protein
MDRRRKWSGRDTLLLSTALALALAVSWLGVHATTTRWMYPSTAYKLLTAPGLLAFYPTVLLSRSLGDAFLWVASLIAWGSGTVALASLGMRWRRRRRLFYAPLVVFLIVWGAIIAIANSTWNID